MIEQRWSQVMQAPVPVVVLAAVDDRHGRHGLTRLAQVWADRLRAALAEPAMEHTAAVLASVPVVPLDEEGLLLRVQLADRVLAWAQAQSHAALADYVGPRSEVQDRERHLRLEVRIARGCSDDAAGGDIESARRLAGPCRVVRDLLEAGEISQRHVWPILNRTEGISDEVTVEAIDRIAGRLPRMASTGVGGSITRALAKVDSRAQAAKARAARAHNVGVTFRSLPDGLAQVTATHKVEEARLIMEIIDTTADRFLAHQGDCEPCAEAVPHEIGPARAAAHLAMVLKSDPDTAPDVAPLAAVPEPTAVHELTMVPEPAAVRSTAVKRRRGGTRRRRGETQVVMDFTTWLGLDDNPGMVTGLPIPR